MKNLSSKKMILKSAYHWLNYCFLLAILMSSCGGKTEQNAEVEDNPWDKLDAIRAQIKAPEFPSNDFLITDYGAIGDGETKNTTAFQKAIQECHDKGGGRVIVPEGTFLTGAIHLKSNVNLHLADSAVILFSRDTADYLPMVFSRWEGMELMNYSPFIYAYEQENIAITGNGTLDGNANNEYWWPWCGAKIYGWEEGQPRQTADRDLLHELNHQETDPATRIFGPGHYLRPQFIQTYKCNNVLISDVKMINSPMWNIHPVLCENVTIQNVKIISLGPNNDGCNPESSKNVLIKDCYFDTGDDCIAIKSGRNHDGRRINKPSENIIIEGCYMKEGHGGVVIGSEVSGGTRNVYAYDLVMDSPLLDRVLRIKTSSQRGGVVENIFMKDVKVGTYKEAAIKCNMFYEEPGEHMPVIRNIIVENLEVENGGEYAVLVEAYEESPVENLKVINSNIKNVKIPLKVDHVKNMEFENVTINGEKMTIEEANN